MATEQPPPSASPALLALVAAYQAQTLDIRNRAANLIAFLWNNFRRIDDVAKARFVAEVVPFTVGAQVQMASLTTSFLAQQRQLAVGGRFEPLPIEPDIISGPAVRNGVSLDEVYARPFNETWFKMAQLPKGDEFIRQARLAGERRAQSIMATNLQLAKTHAQALATENDDKVAYTVRILEGATSCGLCVVASTQRYGPGDLMPIHPGCDCSQQTIYVNEADLPPKVIDLDTLQNLQQRIEERFGTSDSSGVITVPGDTADDIVLKYRDILVTHEHGEIGPVLGVRGQQFSDLADLTS